MVSLHFRVKGTIVKHVDDLLSKGRETAQVVHRSDPNARFSERIGQAHGRTRKTVHPVRLRATAQQARHKSPVSHERNELKVTKARTC